MSLGTSGYVLEPVRCGQSNGTFTQTPDVYISNQAVFSAAYPNDETAPRTDYLVLVTSEGVTRPGLLESARFGYTKNEVIDRFGYDAQAGGFRLLRGAAPIEVGVLGGDSNDDDKRLRVRPPAQLDAIVDAPFRVSVGSVGSGTQWAVTIVPDDAAFGEPNNLSVELSKDTGNLNWNADDLVAYKGQRVRFQQQQFFLPKDSNGRIGLAPILASDPVLMLNPLPGPGQLPRLRFGYGFFLTSVEEVNEAALALSDPLPGTVHWARDSGRLRFNSADASANVGVPVYYDGVMFAVDLALPSQSLGLITAPSLITNLPPTGVDLIFCIHSATPYYRLPSVVYRAVDSFDGTGKKGEVQVDPTTGLVRFSVADQIAYAGKAVTLYFGDLSIERGISIRMLRNPVNLDGALLAVKDVTRIYTAQGATWADPIIASPQVSLPSLPIDNTGHPTVVRVMQGQGSYVNDNFPDLDTPSPPAGLGYYIDYDQGALFFAQRKNHELVPVQGTSSDLLLPDQLLISSNLSLEIETGPETNVYTPLTVGDDVLVDTTSGVVSWTSTHTTVVTGVADITLPLPHPNQLTDEQAHFVLDGVQAGHLVVIADSVYSVAAVVSDTVLQLEPPLGEPVENVTYTIYESREVLADRYFDEVVLLDPSTKVERLRPVGPASNGLSVPPAYVKSSGFRLGASPGSAFATVVLVPDDLAFTEPPSGTAQISEKTGNVRFAQSEVGTPVYWARTLTPKLDYQLQPELGLVQFADRMLTGEEVRITYTVAPPSTTPPTKPGAPITEYARFLIRKEVTREHPTPTSTLRFNKAGLPVASNPAPAVFRGGRPQKLGTQCTVDTALSQITFLPDAQLTDALPHGATVAPNERVYIDYYVTQAVGGEKTFTVLQPPLLTAVVTISDVAADGGPNNRFVVQGDQTARFPGGYLMRIETEQLYLIGSSSYDAEQNQTTVELYDTGARQPDEPSQVFQDTYHDPKVYVSSGPTPFTAAALTPAYFAEEQHAYEAIARGSNTFLLVGDQTRSYRAGTIVLFTDTGGTFTDFIQVFGAGYDATTARTTVMLAANASRQYVHGAQLLLRSIRPIFEPSLIEVQTSLIPKLTQPYRVYRRISGQVGEIVSPSGYTIDDMGRIIFGTALRPLEEFSILYTGLTLPGVGLNLRASYTSQITPSVTNGLLGQTLLADYYIRSPDSFYFRVETMAKFRGEYAAEIATSASSGSSGPQTSNASQPKLWEQGRKSIYFDERHLANQDTIARTSLLFYNDLINSFETYRRQLDGTVVGNNDGPLLFDGSLGVAGPAGNQIDDTVKVSDAPYVITYPPYGVTSIGTYKKYYLPGPLSRFYPTAKNFFGVTKPTGDLAAGADVLDTRATNITQVSNLHTRQAWGVVTEDSKYSGMDLSGNTILKLDFASGDESGFDEQVTTYARPPFYAGMLCRILRHDGSEIVGSVSIVDVVDFQVTVSGSFSVPVGSTIHQLQTEALGAMMTHAAGRDYSFNGESGQVTYVVPAEENAPPNVPLIGPYPYAGSLTLINTLTEPLKFPALFGGIEDDDGELSFPIQTPDPHSEKGSYLGAESSLIRTPLGPVPAGLIRDRTTEPKISSGSVVSPNFRRIVDATIGAMVPAPQEGDLVRILSGTNADNSTGRAFRRIKLVGSGYLDLDDAAPAYVASTGFTYELVVSPVIASGNATSGSLSQLTHTGASFLSTVKVGHTIVLTVGGVRYRRQVSAVHSDTTVSFSPNLPNPGVTGTTPYYFDNSLATYGNRSTGTQDHLLAWDAALAGLLSLYADEETTLQTAIEQASTGMSYFGLPAEIVTKLSGWRDAITALIEPLASLRAKLEPASVVGTDAADTFVVSVLGTDLDAREAQVNARLSDIDSTIAEINDILANTERLYDKRYVWLDTRINLENGLLVRQEVAVKNRLKAQAEAVKQLTKLLAVGGI